MATWVKFGGTVVENEWLAADRLVGLDHWGVKFEVECSLLWLSGSYSDQICLTVLNGWQLFTNPLLKCSVKHEHILGSEGSEHPGYSRGCNHALGVVADNSVGQSYVHSSHLLSENVFWGNLMKRFGHSARELVDWEKDRVFNSLGLERILSTDIWLVDRSMQNSKVVLPQLLLQLGCAHHEARTELSECLGKHNI